MLDPLALAVAWPLLGALLTAMSPRWAQTIGIFMAVGAALDALWLVFVVAERGPLTSDLGGWGVPLGIALRADGLAAAFLVMVNLVGLGVSIHASGYFAASKTARHFWPLWFMLWTALNALWLSGDLFNLYVTLELTGLSAAALGALGGSGEAVAANLRYLLFGLAGSMTYLLGVALLYVAYGNLDLIQVAGSLTPGPASDAACALMIGGLLLKAALFPLHFWLPPAHSAAPAPVSAALSALVVKAAIYLILRLWLDLFAGITSASAAMLLGLLGGVAVLWGSWQALRAERLKLLAAYSTLAQIGYLAMFLPLFHATPDEAARTSLLAAWVLLALTHGLAKAGFFLAAGLVQKSTGHDRVRELGGAAQSLPAATFALGLAGAALIGLPPSGTFFAKWLLIQTAIVSGQWWWVPVIMLGTLLAVGYVFRLLARAFTREPTPAHFVTDARTELPALVLAALSVLGVGLAARPIAHLLGV